MRYFTVQGSRIAMSFEEIEREILTGFFGQVRAILHERTAETGQAGTFGESGDDAESLLASLEQRSRPLPPPDDPAIARLLPSGRRDEVPGAGESAIEFRRLTEQELRTGKMADAEVAERLVAEQTDLGLDDATTLLRALNDVRLSLGARLEIAEDTPYPASIENEQDQALAIYFWTGGVQEELLEAVVEVDDAI
ncbi:DUF2017 family protein [Cumulibacter manganitolerans]|uniref:DUF2017 family protein n=1 Tax=Cumulibacter manganitolerans TaxID=1884992 RepID=UPI0012950D0F|nr:DUF2017 family protein [Cumulibacter manganitolerans]